jgi:hypothetical protein
MMPTYSTALRRRRDLHHYGIALVLGFTSRLRPNRRQASAWAEEDTIGDVPIPRLAHAVDLQGGADELHARLWESRRRGIKKAKPPASRYVCTPAVGGNVALGDWNHHATRGALNETGMHSGVRYLLDWVAIQEACADGSHWRQMGESGFNEKLGASKERFGTTTFDCAGYRLERLPITSVDVAARWLGKEFIGFKD